MKTKLKPHLLLLLLTGIVLIACNEYKEVETQGKVVKHEIALQLPLNIKDAQLADSKAVMTNI